MCSSSSAADARTIGVAVDAARRPVAPVAEGGPQAFAARRHEAPDLVERASRRAGSSATVSSRQAAGTRRARRRRASRRRRGRRRGRWRSLRPVSQGVGAGSGADYHLARLMELRRFRTLAVATAVTTVVLFAWAAWCAARGSGLGCATWPTCFPGQLFPGRHDPFPDRVLPPVPRVRVLDPRRRHGVLRLARLPSRERRSLWPALAAVPLVLGQAVLGGIVVKTELNPWWVTAHFAVALAFVADVTFVAATASCSAAAARGRRSARGPGLRAARAVHDGRHGALLLVGTLRAGEGRRPGLHGLAADGREARPGARGRRHRDVRCTGCSPPWSSCSCSTAGAGPHDDRALADPRAALHRRRWRCSWPRSSWAPRRSGRG